MPKQFRLYLICCTLGFQTTKVCKHCNPLYLYSTGLRSGHTAFSIGMHFQHILKSSKMLSIGIDENFLIKHQWIMSYQKV